MMAMASMHAYLRQVEQALGRALSRHSGCERFPAAAGASDRELMHLGWRDDPLEILRRARMETETGVRRGLIRLT
jgi:hypothetical protein